MQYPQVNYFEVNKVQNNGMDKWAFRRQALQSLIDTKYNKVAAAFARENDFTPSYVTRMLYPDGKKGRKRIAEDSIDKINKKHPDWLNSDVNDAPTLVITDPLIADLKVLHPVEAELWQSKLDRANSELREIQAGIRAAAYKARETKTKGESIETGAQAPPLIQKRTA